MQMHEGYEGTPILLQELQNVNFVYFLRQTILVCLKSVLLSLLPIC